MVDVTAKALTHRRAATSARVTGVQAAIVRFGPGGRDTDALSVARVAGLRAGKATSQLLPLCHPLPLTDLSVDFDLSEEEIEVHATAETVGQTGVEMEALTACALAALSLVNYLGPTDAKVRVEDLTLLEKRGGRSGTWIRTSERPQLDEAVPLAGRPLPGAGSGGEGVDRPGDPLARPDGATNGTLDP